MLDRLVARLRATVLAVQARILRWTRPSTRPILGFIVDHVRSRTELVQENALLRKQLEVVCRQIRRPQLRRTDRAVLVLLARLTPRWRQAVLLVQPETILRWHRQGFKLLGWHRSKRGRRRPRMSGETIALIERMARHNRLWGAERIRGELLKLGIHVAKRTIQKYVQHIRGPRPRARGPSWATFLRHHGHEIWACDFLQAYDLLFRPIFAFFVIELSARRVVHVAVTRSPSSAWVTQQLREATAWVGASVPYPRPRRQVRQPVRHGGGGDRDQGPAHAGAGPERQRRLRALPPQRARRMPRPPDYPGGGASARHPPKLRRLLQHRAAAPRHRPEGTRRATGVPDCGRGHRGAPCSRRPPPRVPPRGVARTSEVASMPGRIRPRAADGRDPEGDSTLCTRS
jgi:hypothetical protein